MRIGIGAGPRNTPRHQSSHYVYDVRSGAIVAIYHFAGATPEPAPELMAELLKSLHDASGIPGEHLGILSGPDVPVDDGERRRLVRALTARVPAVVYTAASVISA